MTLLRLLLAFVFLGTWSFFSEIAIRELVLPLVASVMAKFEQIL